MESTVHTTRRRRTALLFALASIVSFPGMAAATDLVSWAPEKAVVVGLVRVEDLRTSPLTGKLFDHTDRITTDGEARQFLDDAGLSPVRDVDTVLMAVVPSADDPTEGDVLLAVEGRFDAARLAASVASRGALARSANGRTYYLLPDSTHEGDESDDRNAAVALVSDQLAFAGTEPAVVGALAALGSGGTNFRSASPLGHEMRRIDPKATAWLLVDVQRAARLSNSPQANLGDGRDDVVGSAIRHVSTIIVWGRDAGDAVAFGGTALTVDAETRDLIEDTLRGITAAWRLAMQDKAPEWIPVIRSFTIEQSGEGVTMTGSIPASLIEKQASRMAANSH